MILKSVLAREFKKAIDRRWQCIYVAVDFHDTIFKSLYHHKDFEFFDGAERCLKYLTDRPDVVLIGWSSLSMDIYKKVYDKAFLEKGIVFRFLNENPLEGNTHYADFSKKFYFNILIDDKAGWNANTGDWQRLHAAFQEFPIIGSIGTQLN
jgi:hypothetical protein